MVTVQCENMKEHRNKIMELKALDDEFRIDTEKDRLFFLVSEEKVMGYAILNTEEKSAELKRIFIKSKIRNNGYGTILLKNIINWLIKNNYNTIIVKNHKKMNNFLEKQRFLKTETGYILTDLTENKKKEDTLFFVSKFAIAVNIFLILIKITAGKFFNSGSLLADGLNSLSDLITNIIVILGVKLGGNPEDKEHPFGHGKIESVFSIIIGTFIMMAAFNMIQENIMNFLNRQNIKLTPLIFVVTIFALAIKIFQFTYIKYKTRKYEGQLINSLLKDYKADIIITVSVITGILLSRINPVFDTLTGILVAFYIFRTGYSLIKENSMILLDSQDQGLLEKIKYDVLEFEEVENAHDFRMTTSGKDIFIIADIRVNKNITVSKAHEITNKISKFIKHKYKNIKRITLHVEPVYESQEE